MEATQHTSWESDQIVSLEPVVKAVAADTVVEADKAVIERH